MRSLASVTTFRSEGINSQFCCFVCRGLFESHTLLILSSLGLNSFFRFQLFQTEEGSQSWLLNVGKWYEWRDNIEFPGVISAKIELVFSCLVEIWYASEKY